MFKKLLYYIVFSVFYALSLLPWWLHYLWSDYVLFPIIYHVKKYRRSLVRQQLAECFPEKSEAERLQLERDFYHWFADYFAESVKQVSMSHDDFCRHMTFEGVDEMVREVEAGDSPLAILYLGHFTNWEWITSVNLHVKTDTVAAQVYHPLENEVMDRLMLHNRSKCGANNVPMNETARFVTERQQEGRKVFLGCVADQSPARKYVRYWMQWMRHESPVIIGTEVMGRRFDAVYYYMDVYRVRRGYYHTVIRRIDPKDSTAEYPITEAYMQAVEESILRDPALWLWTHKRWKHKREDFD